MKKIWDIPFYQISDDWKIIDCMKNKKAYHENKSQLINKRGNKISIIFSNSLIEKENFEVGGCICIFRDNTENEKLQQQIIRAEKLAAIGRLTSGITHEIRNPLLPIMTASEFLISKENDISNCDENTKLLKIIYEESKRLSRFLDQLSEIDGKNIYSGGKGLVLECLEETILLVSHSMKKRNIKLIKNYQKKDFYVPLSKDQLKQMFLNLLLNSIDSIEEKNLIQNNDQYIKITISNNINNLLIIVEDTGIGIDDENINNIFDPFYTTKEKGTGLGLPIISNLILSCGGEIQVESQYGKGTKFSITIPLINDD